jgi:hypothetical protein
MMRIALAAAASLSFAGAQKLDAKSLMSEQRAELAFDPNAVLRMAAESSFGRQVSQFLRRGNRTRQRNFTSDWRNAPNHRKTAREQRNEALGRNLDRVDYFARRMAWLEANPEVMARREYQREHRRSPAAGQFARVA